MWLLGWTWWQLMLLIIHNTLQEWTTLLQIFYHEVPYPQLNLFNFYRTTMQTFYQTISGLWNYQTRLSLGFNQFCKKGHRQRSYESNTKRTNASVPYMDQIHHSMQIGLSLWCRRRSIGWAKVQPHLVVGTRMLGMSLCYSHSLEPLLDQNCSPAIGRNSLVLPALRSEIGTEMVEVMVALYWQLSSVDGPMSIRSGLVGFCPVWHGFVTTNQCGGFTPWSNGHETHLLYVSSVNMKI